MKDTSATTTEIASCLEELHCACFACGEGCESGLKLHFEIDSDCRAVGTWQPSASFRSYPDRVHGGVIAALLDSSMVHALFAKGVAGVTAELNIRYLLGVNLIDAVRVEGWVESERHGLYLCRAVLHQSGVPVVRASAKFMKL